MADIVLDGDIGWNITPGGVKNALKGKGDVIISLNTPGGYVFDGIEIYNAIKEHPGNVVIETGALVASCGGWIMLAADEVWVKENTTFMMHRVQGGVWGNADEMRKGAEINEGLEGLILDIFEKKMDRNDAREKMNSEFWAFGGNAIVELGLADEVIKADDDSEELNEENQNKFKAMVNNTLAKVENFISENKSDFFSRGLNFKNKLQKNESKFITNKQTPENKQEKSLMNLDKLKNEYPELYAEVLNLGIQREKNRAGAWMVFNDLDPEAVKAGVDGGKEISSVDFANFQRKQMNKAALTNMDEESPADTTTPEGSEVAAEQTAEEKAEEAEANGEVPQSAEAKALEERMMNKYGGK